MRARFLIYYVTLLIAGALYIGLSSRGSGVLPTRPDNEAETRTAALFDSIRDNPARLVDFLRQMPKGGDLHSHLTGAIYAENYIALAARYNLCWDTQSASIIRCGLAGAQPISAILADETPTAGGTNPKNPKKIDKVGLYRAIVDALSMRNWQQSGRNAHDQFFDSFGKFGAATGHLDEMLAEVMRRAAAENLSYLELMVTLDDGASKDIAAGLTWDPALRGEQDELAFAAMREKLLATDLPQKALEARQNLTSLESQTRVLLQCGSSGPCPTSSDVAVRFLFQVRRDLPPQQVFAQMLMAYLMVQADQRLDRANRRVVGLNLVAPEDYYIPRRDFSLHMRMLNYFHRVYQEEPAEANKIPLHTALHAGELTMGLLPPDELRYHIRMSVNDGHAERIGHGVSVMYEDAPYGLLQELAQRNVMVEICLTSNDLILGVRGIDHPLQTYLKYKVPVALATDDEGISRSNITAEYLKAVRDQGLSYLQLKQIARASLHYAFIDGKTLWSGNDFISYSAACAADKSDGVPVSTTCEQFLRANDKARLQWEMEKAFSQFEQQYR